MPKDIIVEKRDHLVVALAGETVIASGVSPDRDHAVLQAGLDATLGGGKLSIGCGTYRLAKALRIDHPCLLVGEGYGTKLVPAQGCFALEALATERSPLRRALIDTDDAALLEMENRTFGIVVRDLCIDGEGSGKGLFASFLIECTFENLWIHNAGDGAGIYIAASVMETVFENIHLLGCGAETEASIVIAAQPDGDACNNIVFEKVFVIFPNGSGIMIGPLIGPAAKIVPPRLVSLRNCVLHGWLPVADAAPFPLLEVIHLDSLRGLRMSGCRITNSGIDHPQIHLWEGEAKITDTIFGGGGGLCAVMVEPPATLTLTGNTFHGSRAAEAPGDIVLCAGTLIMRDNVARGVHGRVVLAAPIAALIHENIFDNAKPKRPCIEFIGTEAESGVVKCTGNVFLNAADAILAVGLDRAELVAHNIVVG
jgi:hypothetical protein